MRRLLRTSLICLALACAHGEKPSPLSELVPEPPVPIVPPTPMPDEYRSAEGSLWRGEESRRFLAFEARAKRVGDLVTVLIEESARAQNQASTKLERESDIEATVDSEIALQTIISRPILNLLNALGFTDQRSDESPTGELSVVEATTTTEYEGDGRATRQASFTTKVACIVTDVTSTGLLKVEGVRNLKINEETQVIRLSGYVRPEDVQIDNTIPSALIASADIEYTGVGVISEEQRPPWMLRVLQWVLPF